MAYDRELCVAYYDEITRLLADTRRTETGRGRSRDDRSGRQRTNRPAGGTASSCPREQEAAVKARFRDPADPLRFLIVTAKLLTGFDAETEGVMYLDKPLRLHTLFQAICRTNRRWTNPLTGQEKLYGLIVDYVGLGNQIARALRDADPDRGGRRPVDVDGLAEEFVACHRDTRLSASRASTGTTPASPPSWLPRSASRPGTAATSSPRSSCGSRDCGSSSTRPR